jgi:hypothetical protein
VASATMMSKRMIFNFYLQLLFFYFLFFIFNIHFDIYFIFSSCYNYVLYIFKQIHITHSYNVYSKALFDRAEAASVYRPKRDDSLAVDGDAEFKKLSETSKFKPDKGFRGADSLEASSRDGPVQFQKHN